MEKFFAIFANKTAKITGSAWAFLLAVACIAVWAFTGPMFNFSENWQLVINTGTTIITFLMVFLIQNTQNRDARAIHLKLDELIIAIKDARNEMVDIEELSGEELEKIGRKIKIAKEKGGNVESLQVIADAREDRKAKRKSTTPKGR